MIKNFVKKAAIVLTAVVLITSSSPASAGESKRPETVRVGLYYKGGSVNTAQSLFDVSAKEGLLIGFSSDDSFVEICKEASPSKVYIRKDSYYNDSGSGLKEFDPTNSKTTGTKYGPYHIRIGNDHPDALAAGDQVSAYRQDGIEAYIAYDDAWQVWTGAFTDESEADERMDELIPVLGDIGLEIVKPSSNRIAVIDSQYEILCIFGSDTAGFQIRPAPENDPPVISIKGKQYRGALEVKRLSNSDMTLINIVSIQEYLYGNVPPEIGGRSPAEALKAQAVASKMYALNNKGKHGSTGFDVCATTHCQVYKGYSVEVPGCNEAIDEVYDKIITYEGEPVKHIYYFASGGGSTEDVRNVWGSSYPYLVSVEDKYEKIYTWTKTLRATDVKTKLPQLGSILGITITRTAPSGRVTQLAVTGASRGEPAYYSNEKCRTLFGLDSQLYTITSDADVFVAAFSETPRDISDTEDIQINENISNQAEGQEGNTKNVTSDTNNDTDEDSKADGNETDSDKKVNSFQSITDPIRTQLGGKKVITATGVSDIAGSNNKITVIGANGAENKTTVVPETYTFTGKGWGHAVGMSQEGAIGMGKAGISYEEILMHYFQGTKVK